MNGGESIVQAILARLRHRGRAHAGLHPPAAAPGHGQAHPPRGARDALRQGRHADHGRPAHRHRRARHRGHPGADHRRLPRRLHHRAAGHAGAGRWLLGTADDWLNARTGDGISATQKLLWQTVVAGVAAWQIQDTYQIDQLAVPFVGAVDIHPIVFILIAAFAIVATSNAVNITDGLDGLAGRHADLRLHRLHGHRLHLRPAQPGGAVRAHHRRPARVPLVQRPPGPDLHGRLRLAGPRRDAGGHRASSPARSCCCRSSASCS